MSIRTSIVKMIKRALPSLFAEYQHIQRLRIIKKIEEEKKRPESEYPKLLAKIYKERMGHALDWHNLRTYTEKMQWEKIYDKNPLKSILADKYLVRKWVSEKIGDSYLIPLLGVWDSFSEINFSELPDRFVLKTNHGTGTNLIVKDKNTINYKRAKKCFDDWMNMDFAFVNSYQLHYSKINRKIIAEQYLETDRGELQDYKFLCFDGEPKYCWVDLGRFSNHTRTVFDLDWTLQPWTQQNYGISKEPIPKPKNFEKMIEIARILSCGFSHVRVDLYNVNGQIFFGEMTFTNGSGLDPIVPEKYDLMLGELWNIPTDSKANDREVK